MITSWVYDMRSAKTTGAAGEPQEQEPQEQEPEPPEAADAHVFEVVAQTPHVAHVIEAHEVALLACQTEASWA